MSKFLFIITHADTKGTSTAYVLAKAAESALVASGNEVRVVDLVQTSFNTCASPADFLSVPEGRFSYAALQGQDNLIPAIREQQANLEWATHVIVIGPIWFYRFPANLYAYQDRVFTAGWAYNFGIPYDKQVLYGKKAFFVITTGAPAAFYSHGGPLTSIDGLLYPTTFSFNGSGFAVYRTQGIWEAAKGSAEEQEKIKQKFVAALLNLEKRPLLPFGNQDKPAGTDDVQIFAALPNISLDEAVSF
jgi:putative NADPH-quinone reductase